MPHKDWSHLLEKRAARAAAGQCPHCGVSVAGTGFKYCAPHREVMKEKAYAWKARNRAQVQRADRAAKRARSRENATLYRARYHRLRAAGLCVHCGRNPATKLTRCLGCRQWRAELHAERRAKAEGRAA